LASAGFEPKSYGTADHLVTIWPLGSMEMLPVDCYVNAIVNTANRLASMISNHWLLTTKLHMGQLCW